MVPETTVRLTAAQQARRTKGVLYLRKLPAALKLEFKATTARRQETMEEVINELIRKYVADPGCVTKWRKKREKKAAQP
jgi:tRNA uridine 5-carbamoylmethylation protein Kti12